MRLTEFVRRQLSEPDGSPSNNRVLLALLIVVMLALLVAAAGHGGWKLPEVPASLETFVEWTGGILVGGSVLGKFAAKGASQ